jgi:hypothetical protein
MIDISKHERVSHSFCQTRVECPNHANKKLVRLAKRRVDLLATQIEPDGLLSNKDMAAYQHSILMQNT